METAVLSPPIDMDRIIEATCFFPLVIMLCGLLVCAVIAFISCRLLKKRLKKEERKNDSDSEHNE